MIADRTWQRTVHDGRSIEFCLNVYTELKIFVITVKGFEPTISCVRDQDATTVPGRHM